MGRQKHRPLGGSWEPAGFSRQVKSKGRMMWGVEGEAGENTLFSELSIPASCYSFLQIILRSPEL